MEQQVVRLRDLFTTFFKIGLFTFGGGFAMIPLIRREVIQDRKWVRDDEFIELLTLAQSAPGPIALNTAVFVGYRARGYKGALSAITGVILPSFAILLMVAIFFSNIRDNKVVDAAFNGMRPVVIALIMSPLISLMKGMSWQLMVATAFIAFIIWWFNFSPITMLALAIFIGVIWAYRLTRKL